MSEVASSSSSTCAIKKVDSQVNIDGKTSKVESTSTSTDCDLAVEAATGDNVSIKLQNGSSGSLPDLQSSPSSTSSSSSNNQSVGHGKHVILAVESADNVGMNQMNNSAESDFPMLKQKIKLNINIDPNSNGSSSSASSNNLEYGNNSNSNTL